MAFKFENGLLRYTVNEHLLKANELVNLNAFAAVTLSPSAMAEIMGHIHHP